MAVIDEQTDKRPIANARGAGIPPTPSQKLVLPAVSPASSSPQLEQTNGHEQHTVAMSSELQQYHPLPPTGATPATHAASSPLASPPPLIPYKAAVASPWRNDPAYKFLLAAIALVIMTGIVFTVYAFNIFVQAPSVTNQGKQGTVASQTGSKGAPAQGTADLHPSFPTPGGSTAGNQPTQSATVAPTPTPALPPTAQATQPPPPNGNLAVQITGYPQRVSNNSTVSITIQANQPGVAVQLLVTYNAPPDVYGSNVQGTDGGGNATLSWHVRVLTHGSHPVTARVMVAARDQNGHIAQSQVVTVQIVSGNTGG